MAENNKIVIPLVIPLTALAIFMGTWFFRGSQIKKIKVQHQIVIDSLHTINTGLVNGMIFQRKICDSIISQASKQIINLTSENNSLKDQIESIAPYRVVIEYQPWILDSLKINYWPDTANVDIK